MAETRDPVAALADKALATRAAGARDLAEGGGPEHIDLLLQHATTDPSPGVRLSAATAAADILSRHRVRAALPVDDRERWLRVVSGVDPSVNTALFQVAAVLGLPAGVNRVIVGLRDPRHDVRAGACVGLRRLLTSAAENGNSELESRVLATLSDARVRIETRVEIARICANVGLGAALEPARALADEAIRQTKKLADDTVARLEAPPSPVGLWTDLGCDADEAALKPKAVAWMAILGGDEAIVADARGVRRAAPEAPVRVVVARRPGEEAGGLAVQAGRATWWAADGDDLCELGDRIIAAKSWDLFDAVDPLFGASAAGLRTRGAALIARGRTADALLALEEAVAGKRVPADAWWFLGAALTASGRGDDARPHIEKYLSKAGKKGGFVAEARKLLGE